MLKVIVVEQDGKETYIVVNGRNQPVENVLGVVTYPEFENESHEVAEVTIYVKKVSRVKGEKS